MGQSVRFAKTLTTKNIHGPIRMWSRKTQVGTAGSLFKTVWSYCDPAHRPHQHRRWRHRPTFFRHPHAWLYPRAPVLEGTMDSRPPSHRSYPHQRPKTVRHNPPKTGRPMPSTRGRLMADGLPTLRFPATKTQRPTKTALGSSVTC